MSTAVVAIELTGQLSLQLPVLVSTVASYLVSRLLGTPSLFDAFVAIKNLPGATTKGVPLSADGPLTFSSLTIRDPRVQVHLERVVVPQRVRRAGLHRLLQLHSSTWCLRGVSLVPVVESEERNVLIGCIHVDALNALAAESSRSADEVRISDTISDTISDDTPQAPPYLPPPLPPVLAAQELTEPLVAADTLRRPLPLRTAKSLQKMQKQRRVSRLSTGGGAGGSTGSSTGGEGNDGAGCGESEFEGGSSAGAVGSADGDDETIDVLYNADGSARDGVDLSPLMVNSSTRLARLSSLLRLLGASTAFVTDEGLCSSYVTRVTLFHVESQLLEDERERDGSFSVRSSSPLCSPRTPISPAPPDHAPLLTSPPKAK